ncbi:E3 ubiquitin-protein ligase ubr1, partial [Coemansia sp. RSA 2673]
RVLRSAQEEARATERKKQAAKARQAAILADFANRQQDFMTQFGEEYDDLSDDENANASGLAGSRATAADKGKGKDSDLSRAHKPLWSAPSGSPDEVSTLSSAKSTGLSRAADHTGAASQVAAGAYGAPSGLKGFPVLYHELGIAASTCGHMMHVRCFMQYCQGIETKRQTQPTRNHPENLHRKEYLCPLCKSLGNVLLPALPHVVDYDPLVAADRDPERFLRPAADQPAASTMLFETWMQSEWRDFGDALVSASGNQNASAAFAATAQGLAAHGKAPALDGGAAGASARDGQGATGSMAGSAAVGTSSAPPTDESAVSGLAAALRSSGSFSFNLAD